MSQTCRYGAHFGVVSVAVVEDGSEEGLGRDAEAGIRIRRCAHSTTGRSGKRIAEIRILLFGGLRCCARLSSWSLNCNGALGNV